MSDEPSADPRGPRPQRDFTVDATEEGSRLETYLQKALGYSRPTALKALRKGWVRLDGKRAKGAQRVELEQIVRITNYALLPPPALGGQAEEDEDYEAEGVDENLARRALASVRYQDDDLVVTVKPAGIAVHAGSKHHAGWTEAVGVALGARLTPVGRLDRDTSGLLVLARGRLGARRLFASLAEGTLQRTYLALVQGHPDQREGRIDLPLRKEGPPGAEQMVVSEEGQPAATRYRLRAGSRRASLLEVRLETGRTHQIRAHFAALKHPLLGDPRYGSDESDALTRDLRLERLFLHAGQLVVPHPRQERELRFEEPLPPELARTLRRAGISDW